MQFGTEWDTLTRLASTQHGLFELSQAQDSGISDATLKRTSDTLVRRVAPRVYKINGSVDTWQQRLLIPILQSNRGLASHRAAGAVWGLDGFSRWRRPEVLIERWSRRPRGRGVIVHESTDLRDVDRQMADGLPITTIERTLIDLCAVTSLDTCGTALDDACRRNLTSLDLVRQRFVELSRRGRRGQKKMRILLAYRPGGDIPYASTFEAKVLRLIRRHGLPEPACQHAVDLGDTTVFLDFAWPDVLLGLECDSEAHHTNVRQFQWDRERRDRLQLKGWTIMDFTWRHVRDRSRWVADVIREQHANLRQSGPPVGPH